MALEIGVSNSRVNLDNVLSDKGRSSLPSSLSNLSKLTAHIHTCISHVLADPFRILRHQHTTIMFTQLRAQKQTAAEFRKRQQPQAHAKLPQQTILFLKLPGEIRNLIYHYALVPKIEVNITEIHARINAGHSLYWAKLRLEDALSEPGLTRVSKTIRKETLHIFYGDRKTSFEFSDGQADSCALLWLENLGVEQRHMLQDINILVRRWRMNYFNGRVQEEYYPDTLKKIYGLGTLTVEDESAIEDGHTEEDEYVGNDPTIFRLAFKRLRVTIPMAEETRYIATQEGGE